MPHVATHAGVLPPPELSRIVRDYVAQRGVVTAAQEIGVSRQSLIAIVAGLRIRRGTLLLTARALGWPGTSAPFDVPPPQAA